MIQIQLRFQRPCWQHRMSSPGCHLIFPLFSINYKLQFWTNHKSAIVIGLTFCAALAETHTCTPLFAQSKERIYLQNIHSQTIEMGGYQIYILTFWSGPFEILIVVPIFKFRWSICKSNYCHE